MRTTPRIFIASDFVMDPALDDVAETLRRQGHAVVRGPKAIPGTKTRFAPDRYAEYFAETDVIVVSTRSVVDESVLDAAPKLRGIVFPSIGIESLDMASANRRGLIVANGATPENFQSMAEATVMLMLNLLYDLRRTERLLRENLPRPANLTARMLRGKTVGLIGMGRIATGVVQRLNGWGVNLLACNPGMPQNQAPAGVSLVTLDQLLAASDIVSVHATLTRSSVHLIGAPELARMKPSAFLINTARGGCLDEAAVYSALKEGKIAGAALDAFEHEPLPIGSPLRELSNLILTPHMAGHTRELFASFAPACVDNVQRILSGDLPVHVCNPHVADRWRERLGTLGGC